jgi:hypothetical protein
MCLCFVAVIPESKESLGKIRQAAMRQLMTPGMFLRFLGGN